MITDPVTTSNKDITQSAKNDRIDYLDYARAIGIILVIVGHVNQYNSFCKMWIYSYHMPLFFFLSGMLIKERQGGFRTFFIKRVKRLLVPYFLWGLLYSTISFRNIAYICYGSHQTLSLAESLTSLWFLPVLFLANICSEFLISKIAHFRHKNIVLIFVAGGMFLVGFILPKLDYGYPFGINAVFVAIGFMIIAYIFSFVFWKSSTCKIYCTVLVLCISAVLSLTACFNVPDRGYILMAEGDYGNPVIFLVAAISGIVMVICLAALLGHISFKNVKKAISFIGENSLAIFLLQHPFISLFGRILSFSTMPDIVNLAIITAGTLFVCCVLTRIINYFAPQIIGNYD